LFLSCPLVALKIVHNLYVSGCNLNRSVSSAGEHQSDTFVYPILPKRAETFGGFDNPERDPNFCFKKKLDQLKASNSSDVSIELKQESNENSNLNDSPLVHHFRFLQKSSFHLSSYSLHSFTHFVD